MGTFKLRSGDRMGHYCACIKFEFNYKSLNTNNDSERR